MNNDPVFVEFLQRWLKDFYMHTDDGYIWGYVEEQSYNELFTELKALGYSYSVRKSSVNKGKNVVTFSFKSPNVSDAYFFGSPFISQKNINLECILGPNYRQAKEECETVDHSTIRKRRACLTKKMGCPATILVRTIELFDKYVIPEDTSRDVKRQVLKTLKCELESESPPKGQIRHYLKVMGRHTHDPNIAEANDRIHPKLVDEIYKLVNNDVTSTKEIEIHLRKFIEKVTVNKPNFHNKAFYPSRDVIYFHIYNALSKMHGSTESQTLISNSQSPTYNSQSLISDSQSPTYSSQTLISDSQSLTYNSQNLISDSQSPTYNSRSLISDSQSPTYNSQSLISDSQSPTYNSQSPTYNNSQSLISDSQTLSSDDCILESSAEIQRSELLQTQRQLRECIKYLSDISYMCNDQDYLNSCLEKLQVMCVEMTAKLPSCSGIPILPEAAKGTSSINCDYKPSPLRKKSKNNKSDFI